VRAIFPSFLLLTALIGLSLGQVVPWGAAPCVPEAEDVDEPGEVAVAPEGELVVELVSVEFCELVVADSSVFLLQLDRAITAKHASVETAIREEIGDFICC
jgi:hypothetical protein